MPRKARPDLAGDALRSQLQHGGPAVSPRREPGGKCRNSSPLTRDIQLAVAADTVEWGTVKAIRPRSPE